MWFLSDFQSDFPFIYPHRNDGITCSILLCLSITEIDKRIQPINLYYNTKNLADAERTELPQKLSKALGNIK